MNAPSIGMRGLFIEEIRQCIGRPYSWGKQTIETGFDCSGLVVACMNHAGITVPDLNAQGLYEQFKSKSVYPSITDAGQLVFYGHSPSTITHVMVVLDVWRIDKAVLVGARGGDSYTRTIDDAWQQKAFVDAVLSNYWYSNRVAIVDPWR